MKNKMNVQMVSFLQFLMAIFVIMVHSSRLFQNNALHFIQTNLFGRMAVPFFIICSTFFIRAKTDQNPLYLKKYIRGYLKTYLIWSVVYVPYGLYYFNSLSLPNKWIPLGILAALFYLGMCYQLWYLPAFLTGLYLVNTAKRVLSLKWTTVLFFILFTLGSIETYSAFLENTTLLTLYRHYASVFYTSRNGLFFMPIFICLGYILYDYRENLLFSQNYSIKLILSFILLCIEGFIIFPKQGIDKNFLFMVIPFSMFLFNWAIRTDIFRNRSLNKLKPLSLFYFFVHPIFIELLALPFMSNRLNPLYFKWTQLIFTIIGTHFLSLLLMRLSQMKAEGALSRT